MTKEKANNPYEQQIKELEEENRKLSEFKAYIDRIRHRKIACTGQTTLITSICSDNDLIIVFSGKERIRIKEILNRGNKKTDVHVWGRPDQLISHYQKIFIDFS